MLDDRLTTKSAVEFSTRDNITLRDIAERLFSVYDGENGFLFRQRLRERDFLESVIFTYCCEHVCDISDENINQFVALATGEVTNWDQFYDKDYIDRICNLVVNGEISSRIDWYHMRKYHKDTISNDIFEKFKLDIASSTMNKA